MSHFSFVNQTNVSHATIITVDLNPAKMNTAMAFCCCPHKCPPITNSFLKESRCHTSLSSGLELKQKRGMVLSTYMDYLTGNILEDIPVIFIELHTILLLNFYPESYCLSITQSMSPNCVNPVVFLINSIEFWWLRCTISALSSGKCPPT